MIPPNHLSILGIIHTAISVLAIVFAVIALLRDGKINPLNTMGKLYIYFTVAACLTSLPIMKTGHFTPAHGMAIIILVLIPIGVYVKSIKFLGKSTDYVQTIILSTTILLSMIPTTVESLTRLPISHPIADGPNAPVIQMGLLIFFVLYVIGVVYQVIKIRAAKKSKPGSTPEVV
ncbi:hypothetical protein SAMN05216490_1179 [Mucilaginibacter mallensis]|uniref:DUF2306 domain-containing protein n=1 Tax=Mucilaginibacter mallensis TaxID=652787 RepID=A0A1H1SBI7_MUCMA|nr:hypothetical protein [Mucilaginibacter mallensis]SDS45322.1 hypothetical protein SAMN05216490_1179 [Mucilaginibacter mallensis]